MNVQTPQCIPVERRAPKGVQRLQFGADPVRGHGHRGEALSKQEVYQLSKNSP
jgi:hypothetical protein